MEYVKIPKGTFIFLMISLVSILVLSVFFQIKYDNQVEISQTLCELSNTQNEMIETLYPYFKKEVCNYSDELCGQLDTLPEKLNCEDLI